MTNPNSTPGKKVTNDAASMVTRRQELEQQLRNAPADRDGYLELGRIYTHENQPLHAARVLKRGRRSFQMTPRSCGSTRNRN